MRILDKIRMIKRLDYLIRHNQTGDPKNLASKLNVSERSVYDIIRLMKDLGGPIKYDSRRQAYFYVRPNKFEMGYELFENKNIIFPN